MRFCLNRTVVTFFQTGYRRGFSLNSISPSKAQLVQKLRVPNTLLLSFRLPNTLSISSKAQEGRSFDNAPYEMDKESIRLAQENVERASDFVSNAETNVKEWENRVKEWENRVKEWDDLVKVNLRNPDILPLYLTERDKANERLKEARESLKEARESLKEARESLNETHERLAVAKASSIVEEWNNRVKLNSSDTFALERLKEAHERLDNLLKLRFITIAEGSLAMHSEGTVGAKELKRLNDNANVFEAEILKDEDPILSQKEQDEVNCINNESALIEYLTPFFDALLKPLDMVFVNSENIPWLPQSLDTKCDFKPDGFSTHPGMFTKKGNRGKAGRLHGKAVKELLDCVVLFEGKVNINVAAFGQVVRYIKHLNPKGSGSAILFDRTSFQMITSSRGKIVNVVESKWVNEGSKFLFHKFIMKNKPSWILCLQKACIFFNVVVPEGNAFLGRGGFGLVFRVFRDDEEFALKIVEESSITRLHQEVTALKKAKHTNLTIELKEEYTVFSNGAAILLSPVGRSLPQPKEKKDVIKLFAFLHQLHDQGLVHGDPRIPNVILHGNQLLWIDLVDVFDVSVQKSSIPLYKDIATLTRSILCKPHNANLGELESLLIKYSEDASKENLNAVADEVCKILKFD